MGAVDLSGAGSFLAGVGLAGHAPIALPAAAIATSPAGAPKWDPLTKSYPLLANGSNDSTDGVWQEVAHRLGIPLGSLSSSPDIGIDVEAARNATPGNAQRTVEDVVNRALAPMIARGDVQVVRIRLALPWRGKWDAHIKNLRDPDLDTNVFTSP
jgi:hypothetical protein